MKATRNEVYLAIDSERDYQQSLIRKAGRYEEETKPLEAYVLYMDSYLHDVKTALSKVWGPESIAKALDSIRKVAALATAAMETHGAPLRTTPTPHPELGTSAEDALGAPDAPLDLDDLPF